MVKYLWLIMVVAALGVEAQAQDYVGPSSIGSQEPLFSYDDQERWKHGYLQVMPFYHGHHNFLPYNYHHIFGQSQTAGAWGMSPNMPYSQQFWHRYENMAGNGTQQYTSAAPMNYQPQQQWVQAQPMLQMPQQQYIPLQSMQPVPTPPPVVPGVAPVQYQTTTQPPLKGWGTAPSQPAQTMTPVQQYLIEGPALP